MSRLLRNVALALGLVASPAAAQTTINFDNLSHGTALSTQYSGVTFSAQPGFNLFVYDFSFLPGHSIPNAFCSWGQNVGCQGGHTINFSDAVNSVSIKAIGVDRPGVLVTVGVYDATGLLGTVNLTGLGIGGSAIQLDFSQYANVRKLEFSSNIDGIAYDDLTYTTAVAVPEPASALLLLSGVGGLMAVVRRRKTVIEG